MATPLVYAALGGIFAERAGIINIALEGMMLTGAFTGVLATFYSGNPWFGVLAAVLVGGLLGLLHALITVKFVGNQIVSGTGINILALGITAYLSQIIWGSRGASQNVNGFSTISIPLLRDVPIVGNALYTILSQTPLVYIMLILVVLSYVVMFKTPIGLRIRAVGEYPAAADTAGINVYRTKCLCLMVSGMLAGLGGAFLSLSTVNLFVSGMTAGRGFIALAAMILGGWMPFGALGAGLLFGFAQALQMNLQSLGFPPQIMLAIPYVLTVVVLAGFVRKTHPPSDYKPYEKE
jgi:simple sugar transport system permease protein